MKITDGRKTVEIEIKRWNGSGYDPDWSADYFNAGALPYDEAAAAYIVDDVDYCVDMANDDGPEGACCMYSDTGDYIRDEDMHVFVTEID